MFKKYRPTLVRMLTLAVIFSLLGSITGTTTTPAQAQPANNMPSSITLPTDRISLVSKSFYNDQGNGYSGNPTISYDGQYTVFESEATNLDISLPPEEGQDSDIFINDRNTGMTKRVSIGYQSSYYRTAKNSAVSSDGRYVVYEEWAALDEVGVNPEVILYDTSNTQMTYVATNEWGQREISGCPGISANGKYVVFTVGEYTQLLATDLNEQQDVYVRDIAMGDTPGNFQLVSVSSNQVQGNNSSGSGSLTDEHAGICSRPSLSADGRYIAFESSASNLVDGDTNGKWDIFVRDQTLGTTTRVSVDTNENEGGQDSTNPSISPDGRYVAFSTASGLDPLDNNNEKDIYMRDLNTGETVWVSQNYSDAPFTLESSVQPSISANGYFISFRARSHNNEGVFWGTFLIDTVRKKNYFNLCRSNYCSFAF